MKRDEFSPVRSVMCEAGGRILEWRQDERRRRILSKADFKTDADLRAHEWIAGQLSRIFPGVPVLSEESWTSEARPGNYWLIDPIDGTASWYEGFSGFATQAAYIEDARVLYGIVYAPARETVWEAAAGHGAWRNNERLPRLMPSGRLMICDNYPEPRRAAKLLSERLSATGYLESGSLGVKCCLVADGSADLFVKDVVTRDWDIAPAAAVLAEVGGVLSLPNGAPYRFAGEMDKPFGVLAARDAELARRASAVFAHGCAHENRCRTKGGDGVVQDSRNH